jgi:hypothetical protein
MSIGIKEAKGLRKYLGLMFRTKNTISLYFSLNPSKKYTIHSWFCPRFHALCYDSNGDLIKCYVCEPFKTYKLPDKCAYLLEIPI